MYTALNTEDQIRLAAEFLARDTSIPQELADALGPAIMLDLITPEKQDAI